MLDHEVSLIDLFGHRTRGSVPIQGDHRLESRMREIRTYGSEGGGGREASPYPYLPAGRPRSLLLGLDPPHRGSTELRNSGTLSLLLGDSPVLDHEAPILNHADSRLGQLPRGDVVSNPRLKPDVLRSCGDDVIHVRRDVVRPAKHVHHVDRTANLD